MLYFVVLVKVELILSKSVYEAHYTVDTKNKTNRLPRTVTQDTHHISCSLSNIIQAVEQGKQVDGRFKTHGESGKII